jgi:hypothetical protein
MTVRRQDDELKKSNFWVAVKVEKQFSFSSAAAANKKDGKELTADGHVMNAIEWNRVCVTQNVGFITRNGIKCNC